MTQEDERKNSRIDAPQRVSATSPPSTHPQVGQAATLAGVADKLLGAYDTLLDRFMPPTILIDESRQVVDTFSGADRYLRFRARRPSQDVLDLVGEDLSDELGAAIAAARETRRRTVAKPIRVAGSSECLLVAVCPVPNAQTGEMFFAIEVAQAAVPNDLAIACQRGDERYDCNGRDNLTVRERSETTSPSGDLGCLETVSIANLDIERFFDSSNVSVILLDRYLRIRFFTEPAGRMFDLVAHDMGREIRTFAGVLEVPDLIDRIRHVMEVGDPDEIEVHLPRRQLYLLAKINPYRVGDDILGVALTVIDLSVLEHKKQQVRLLSSIVESSDDAIISRDRENRIVTWNAAAEEMFGYSAAQAIGQPIGLILPEDEAGELSKGERLLQKGGHIDHFDSRRKTKDGRIIQVSVRMSPIYDDEYRVVGVSTIERDVSERLALLEQLTLSERKFQDFYNHSPDMYCSVDASSGMIVDCNERMCDELGYAREEILGRSVLDFYSDSARELAKSCFDEFRMVGDTQDEELELLRRDGTSIPVSLNVTAVRDETGRIVRSRSVWRDMSVLKLKDEQVRQSEQRYRNSFQNSAIGIAQVDLAGTYLLANRRLCEIVGYSPEELLQMRYRDITHPDDLVEELKLRDELINGRRETYKLEKRYMHKSGHDVWVSVFVSLERDADGRPVSCHSYVEDISARKELESELRTAISQRDQFLAMLSHELRNPLGAILNTCAVLHRRKALTQAIQGPISVVARQARQMAELLDDLLDVSRITTGKIKLEKAPALLAEVVDEAVESQQALAAHRQQRLIVSYSDDPLRVFGDRSRLVQIVVNLLNNAIKYTAEGGIITVTLERNGRSGMIRVRDTGVGIEPELIESLFEMFAQKDATLDRSSGGMGLGLHLVRRLVDFHGGTITGRSEGVGKGSEFVVELPLSTRSMAARKTRTKSLPRCDQTSRPPIHRIVVVEDIADARNMLVQLLEADDFDVTSAADGESGLSLILSQRPDLAIVDIGLPRLDGYEVARRVRQEIPASELTLVALTGYGQDSDHERVIDAGFDLHLVKPLNPARLESILSRT